MKGKTRNIFPGGNTSKGFYSYYNYILPQRKAEKFFCIKGGPGVGKSTLMKAVAKYFVDRGEQADLMWCSSDPDSLDGVLLKERAVAIVDGTSPHVIDPQNPGAVDEIINLGAFWNEEGIREKRSEIIECNEKTGTAFSCAYVYLRCAGVQYDFMEQVIDKLISVKTICRLRKQLLDAAGIDSDVVGTGNRTKFFASAVTPAGLKNNLPSIVEEAKSVIVIDAPAGFRTEKLLSPLSDRLMEAGLDVEEFYCPMDPEKKLEHIYCPEKKLAIITSNDYHKAGEELTGTRVTVRIDVENEIDGNEYYRRILEELKMESRENILKALAFLRKAKEYHNALEQYYIPNMDFTEIDRVKQDLIEKIEKGNQ